MGRGGGVPFLLVLVFIWIFLAGEGWKSVRTLNECAWKSYVCLQNRPAAGTGSCSSCQCETCVRLTMAVPSMMDMELEARSSQRLW